MKNNKLPIRRHLLSTIVFTLTVIGLSSCVKEEASPLSTGSGEVSSPDFNSIGLTIKTPLSNATVLDKIVIGGSCSHNNYPIKVTSSAFTKTIYSICQSNHTWAAAVDTKNIPSGSFSLSAQTFNSDYSSSSDSINITLNKGQHVCQNSNASDIFANFKSGGDGENSPYIICNSEQFSNIRFYPDKKFILGRDIDFANKVIRPIGTPFKGEIDGQGFMLSNFTVKDITGNGISVGLFKFIHNAQIRNLNIKNAISTGYERVGILCGDWRGHGVIENVKIHGEVEGITFVGGIAGLTNTSSNLTLRNITSEIKVKGNNYIGGLLGYIIGEDAQFLIEDSYLMTNVDGINYTGGVIGRTQSSNITMNNLERIGDISSMGKWVGGLIGESKSLTLNTVKSIGKINSVLDAEDIFIGGLVGEGRGNLIINNSSSISEVSAGGHYIGGAVGKANSISSDNLLVRGSISVLDKKHDSVTRFVGGVAGGVGLNSTLNNTRSFAHINAKSHYVGGLIGVMNGEMSTISQSYVVAEINAHTSHTGGLVGIFNGDRITDSFSQVDINITNPTPSAHIGGLVGQATKVSAQFDHLYSKSQVIINNGIADNVGGLFGSVMGGVISKTQFTGSISGARSKIGGIVGYSKADISNSYVVGDIEGSFRYIGGIAGLVQAKNVSNTFVKANLLGTGEVGGLVGWMTGSGSLQNSYYIGDIGKIPGGIFPESSFGQILGLVDSAVLTNVYYSQSNRIRDENLVPLSSYNIEGTALSDAQLRNFESYNGLIFDESNWEKPQNAYTLPFVSGDHNYATLAWMKAANQGFELPENFDFDPLNRVYPSIFIQDTDILNDLDQNHLAIIDSTEAAQSVVPMELKITLDEPAVNGQIVNGKTLIFGECGIPGNRINITGDFNLSSICQENLRWASILDISTRPIGTININVSMEGTNATQSNIITRSMIKKDDLCERVEAISGTFANSFQNADGINTPFKICHAGHFANIAFFPDKRFELVSDIDFGANTITPIRSVFSGELNGNNHTLKNFLINLPSATGVGLFKLINNATIENLGISDASVTGYSRVGLLAGSWVGQGNLRNINVVGDVKGILYTGGLIGLANTDVDLNLSEIESVLTVEGNNFTGGILGHISTLEGSFRANNFKTNNTVTGLANVGGVVGSILDPNVEFQNMTLAGPVLGRRENVGMLAGHLRGGNLGHITATGDVTSEYAAKPAHVGGLVGLVELTTFQLSDSSFSGAVNAQGDYVGGIVGKLVQGQIQNTQSHGTLNLNDQKFSSIRSYAGGIVGAINESSNMLGSFSTMDIDVRARFVGGLVGRFHGEDSVLNNSHFTGSIKGTTSFIGGVAGFFFGEDFLDNFSTASIEVDRPTPNAYIGGIMGYANSHTSNYDRIYSTGNITITNGIADYVGGLIGFFRGGALKNCYATGDIVGARSSVGGLVGHHRGSTQTCYSTGSVEASFRHAGGLIGYLLNGSVKDSFTLSNVTASAQAGGIVGLSNTSANSIEKVYAFGEVLRAQGSSSPLTEFGPIIGLELNSNTVITTSSHYKDTLTTLGHNSFGSSLSELNAASAISYIGFDFSSSGAWRMPSSGQELPGRSGEFTYPMHEWMSVSAPSETYTVAGSVSGLNYGTVELHLNNSETLLISPNQTGFSFTTELIAGASYDITVNPLAGYESIVCTLSGNSGLIGQSDITNVSLSCPTLESINLNLESSTLGVGESLSLTATGRLSSAIDIDLTQNVNWTSSVGLVVSVSSSGLLTALSSGSSTITAQILSLSSSHTSSVFSAVQNATNLSWSTSSPSSDLNLTLSWAKSTSNISSQTVNIYESNSCSGNIHSTTLLSSTQTQLNFSGTNNKIYTYKVITQTTDGVIGESVCSSSMEIALDSPEAPYGTTATAAWFKGALPVNSPQVSWALDQSSQISSVKIGLGSSFGADNIKAFTNIGKSTTYTFLNLSNLTECAPLFPVLKSVNQHGIESEVVTHTLGFRYDNTAPQMVGSLSINGDATEVSSPEISWSNANDNCAVRFYEMAIGTSPGSDDISNGHKAIGRLNTYTAVSGLHGLNLSLQPNTDYFTSIRAVDYAGNRSLPITSSAWQVVNLGQNLPSLILWLDSSDKLSLKDKDNNNALDNNFNQRVKTWNDISGSSTAHNFFAPDDESAPYYSNDSVFFNGSTHIFTANNHNEINLTTMSEKNISFAFRTENNINNRQVLYEEGGSARGMNIYIDSGRLYCGFWNLPDDGDGAQPFVSVSKEIGRNKTYSVSWVLDYTNYTDANGDDGNLHCFLNNQLIGSVQTTTRVYPHGGNIGIGGMKGDSYFHTGAASGDGALFRGEILEVMITNESVDANVIGSIHNYMLGRWANDDLSKPNNLQIFNTANTLASSSASWEAIDPARFDTQSYEFAIGETPGGVDKLFWVNIGNTLSYKAQDGIDGISLLLEYNTDYYISVRAIDSTGAKSQVSVSDPWRLFNYNADLSNIVLDLQASRLESLVDASGLDANDSSFSQEIQSWLDNSASNFNHDAYAQSAGRRPAYDSSNQEIIFDGVDDGLAIDNSDEINTQTLDQKSITLSFSTSDNISARQVLYEEGGGTRGMNIYLDNGKLYCGFWNDRNDGDGTQPFISVNADINTHTDYVLTWHFNYSNYTGPSGDDGYLDCYLNGQIIGSSNTTSRIFPHSGAIGLGFQNSGSHFHDGKDNAGSKYYFKGKIRDFIINNSVLRGDTIQALNYYLLPE